MTNGVVHTSSPILVSGVYRSGTTFLAALLGAHPSLVSASSTVKFLRFCLGKYDDVSDLANAERLVRETLRRVKVRWQLTFDCDQVLSVASSKGPTTYASLYDAIMKVMLNAHSEETRWVEKLAMQWRDIPQFLTMFPKGKVIHILRDPRDTTASYKAMTFEKGYTYLDAAFNCRGAMEDLISIQELVPETQLLVVLAENIAKNPELEVRKICKFLNLEFDPNMLRAERLKAEGEDWATNTSFSSKIKGFPRADARWPEHLSRAETVFVEMICQPYFSQYGYQASSYVVDESLLQDIQPFIADDFIASRFRSWVRTGKGAQGYRTDPYTYEMKIVFPERFL